MSANILAVAGILFLMAFSAWLAVRSGLRMARDPGPLRLYRVAQASGLAFPGPAGEADMRAAALAARRCAGCASHERCDAMLASGDFSVLRAICPNHAYLERLTRR